MRNSKITLLPIFLMTSSHPHPSKTSTPITYTLHKNTPSCPSAANPTAPIPMNSPKRFLATALMRAQPRKSLRFPYRQNRAKILSPRKAPSYAKRSVNMRGGLKMRLKTSLKTSAKG